MSFDLYVLDLEAGAGVDAVQELLDDESGTLTARLASLVSELEQRFPGLDDDPDASPWASWPLEQPSAVAGAAPSTSPGRRPRPPPRR